MRILHVGKYYPPYRGGIETVVEQLCRGLASRSVEVTAMVSNDNTNTVEEFLHGVRVLRLGRQAVVNSQPLNLDLVGALRNTSYDVLHFHTPNPLGSIAILAARLNTPIVVTHHSDIVRQRILGAPATGAHALLYRKAACIVAATPKHIQYSPILRLFENKCRVIHFPIDAAPYASADDTRDEQLPSDWDGDPLALFVGRLVYYKGVDVLLNALSITPRARLALVGVGPLERKLADQARALGIADRVVFLRSMSGARLRSLYKRARFLVLPSVASSEAFGMVQLEAMAAGRPVISTDLKSGVPYVNQHGKTGLVVAPSDVQALATAMKVLLENEIYANELGRAAQLRVLSEFHPDKIIDAHLDLYRSIQRPAPA